MKVIILCGGKGLRAYPFTTLLPKPMIPIHGTPVLVHLIRTLIRQGVGDIIVASGEKDCVMKDYFNQKNLGANVDVVWTGENVGTADRVLACRELLGEEFMVTYGDGLCDISIVDLIRHHREVGLISTMTCVPLRVSSGVVAFNSEKLVERMEEKPVLSDKWMNIGFFIFNNNVFRHWIGSSLERDILPALVREREVSAFRHEGFFQAVDSYKDQRLLEDRISDGALPWFS